MWDNRVVLGMVHRYGEACRVGDLAAVGLLYSEIVRALDDNDEAARPSEEDRADCADAASQRGAGPTAGTVGAEQRGAPGAPWG
jgi:hypothetical protein